MEKFLLGTRNPNTKGDNYLMIAEISVPKNKEPPEEDDEGSKRKNRLYFLADFIFLEFFQFILGDYWRISLRFFVLFFKTLLKYNDILNS